MRDPDNDDIMYINFLLFLFFWEICMLAPMIRLKTQSLPKVQLVTQCLIEFSLKISIRAHLLRAYYL